ncbi:uncharacterized protein BDV17DRAFT_264839 [Aspergillus undulatus]|uniref:uncharacterized protein n=1 Tax=Aspergillus undulatus TaxID=1810928 RepID=UPI003CCD1E6E
MSRRDANIPGSEFETWARPRDRDRCVQACKVWAAWLSFLVFCWHGYGEGNAPEEMGLTLPWSVKDKPDSISFYAESARITRRVVFEVSILEFFFDAITDPSPTRQTNPLLWSLAMLV